MRSVNLANKLTLARLCVVPLFVLFLVIDNVYCHLVATLIFIAAITTDYYDGKIARARQITTDFGKLLDPLADKIWVSAAFIYFVQEGPQIPAWVVIIIVLREFLVSGLRVVAASSGKVVASVTSGKYKAFCQNMTVIAMLAYLLADEWGRNVASFLPIIKGVVGFTLLITLYSGYEYLRANKDLLMEAIAAT